ncbi:MAG: hypothetical protein FWD92_00540 [Methanomassiliicoccaceae archaeon]|nr:hypothetical protein [Methanomassiliicoccaceae archaeon]
MGFLDKLFKRCKKKKSAEVEKAAVKKSQYGNTQLGKAMTKAVDTINEREKAGKMSAVNAAAYKGRVDGLKGMIGKEEDTGLLQVAQIIGAVNRSV